ncbi:MAG: hypothetical protein AAF639_29390 [Chloroflexota bacterium]
MFNNFEITISSPDPSQQGSQQGSHEANMDYLVTVHDGNKAGKTSKVNFDAVFAHVAEVQKAFVTPNPVQDVFKHMGTALFDALLGGDMFRPYTQAVTRAETQNQKLRLRINTTDPIVAAFPWEYLYGEAWIAVLEAGEDPAVVFDAEVLAALRDE